MNEFQNNLNVLANVLQIMSYEILVHDFNNSDLMEYLVDQRKILKEISEQNKEIISLLKRGEDGN